MRIRRIISCPAILLISFASAAAPQSGEDYGHVRLPPDAYSYVKIPPDAAAVPEQPPQPNNESDEGGEASACKGMGCPPTQVAVAQQLLDSGPDTTQTYGYFESPKHQFAVVGFVKEGWPVSVEYVAEPGTVTILRIRLYHRRKIAIFPLPFYEVAFQANLDALPSEIDTGNPWHRTVKIDAVTLSKQADPIASTGLHVARYDIRSYRLADAGTASRERAPLEVIGMAVGPEVVGSLTLYGAAFNSKRQQIPATNNPPTEMQLWYRTDATYDLLKERIERYSDRDLTYNFFKFIGTKQNATPNTRYPMKWRIKRNLAPGRYRASILAWLKCEGVTLLSAMSACQNNPDFSINASRSVELYK